MFGDLWGHGGVLLQLPLAAAASHAEILQGAAEAGQFVALEMRNGNQRIRFENAEGDIDLAQNLAVHRHAPGVVAAQTVAHEERRADDGVGKAVFDSAGECRNRLLALAGIKGTRVGEKGAGAQGLGAVDDPAQESRPDVGMPAFFTEMDLDRRQIAAPDNLLDTGGIEEAQELGKKILPMSRPQIGEMNKAPHGGSSRRRFNGNYPANLSTSRKIRQSPRRLATYGALIRPSCPRWRALLPCLSL